MSKIGDIRLQLDEQAEALGFESLEQAQQAGCEIDWDKPELIEPLEAAHRAWEKEKEDLLEEMRYSVGVLERHNYFHEQEVMERAIKFVESCHE